MHLAREDTKYQKSVIFWPTMYACRRRFSATPYAVRMQAPQPVKAWGDDAIHDALQFGPSCPQMIFESDNSLEPHDEDCLHLNIYSPYSVSFFNSR